MRDSVLGELREFFRNLFQGQTYLLRKDDERDSSENGARITSVTGPVAERRDETPLLVESKSRSGNAAARGNFPDAEVALEFEMWGHALENRSEPS
jgi:hypothetical protein